MGKSSASTKSKTISTLDAGQTQVESQLTNYLQSSGLGNSYDSSVLDNIFSRENYMKDVAEPALKSFQTYVEPQISASFRRGGLFSQSRGNAVSKALSDLHGNLTTNYSNMNTQANQTKANAYLQSIYTPSANQSLALSYLGTPTTQSTFYQDASGNFFNTAAGGAVMGMAGMGAMGVLGGGSAFGGQSMFGAARGVQQY